MADITKVSSPDDPNRCQASIKSKGQCLNKAVPGGKYCLAHGGHVQVHAAKEKELNNYRLNQWKQRVSEFGSSNKIKDLRDEIAILRVLIEERMNSCRSTLDLLIHTQPLSELIMKVDKLVNSCQNLEIKMGLTLDKSAVVQLAQVIVSIVSKYVEDEDALIQIAAEIGDAIEKSGTVNYE